MHQNQSPFSVCGVTRLSERKGGKEEGNRAYLKPTQQQRLCWACTPDPDPAGLACSGHVCSCPQFPYSWDLLDCSPRHPPALHLAIPCSSPHFPPPAPPLLRNLLAAIKRPVPSERPRPCPLSKGHHFLICLLKLGCWFPFAPGHPRPGGSIRSPMLPLDVFDSISHTSENCLLKAHSPRWPSLSLLPATSQDPHCHLL